MGTWIGLVAVCVVIIVICLAAQLERDTAKLDRASNRINR